MNTPGNKYVNRGISQGKNDLDNSIIQPLNSSVVNVRDLTPEEKNPIDRSGVSRRYVNQGIVRQTSTTPNGRTSLKTIQRVSNPLSPDKSGSRIIQSRVISGQPQPARRVITSTTSPIQNRPMNTSTITNKNMPWSSIPKKEIALQNASQVEHRPIVYRQPGVNPSNTVTYNKESYVKRSQANPVQYTNGARVISSYPKTTTQAGQVINRQVVARPGVTYQSNTPL